MKAVKGNKSYTVDEKSKVRYVNDGFDIVGNDGTVIEHGKGKKVTYEEYQAVLKELEALKSSMAEGSGESTEKPENAGTANREGTEDNKKTSKK